MVLLRSSLQVLTAVAAVIILFIIGYSIFNREYIKAVREWNKLQNRVDIFKGIKDMAIAGGEIYSTTNDKTPMYMNLKSSVNQASGIEFTYNFWLYKDSGFVFPAEAIQTDRGLSTNDVVLLLRGLDKPSTYKNICGNVKTDLLLKCPLIKLENNGDALTVEFNTEKSPDVVHEGAKNTCMLGSTEWEVANSYKVAVKGLTSNSNFDKKWFMVTVVIQDTYPVDPEPIRNKVRVRIYINGVLELDQYVDSKLGQTTSDASILKPNNGNLYVMPKISLPSGTTVMPTNDQLYKIMMADLSYFNYVIDEDMIQKIYKNSFNMYSAVSPAGANTQESAIYAQSYTDGKKRQLQST
ncbi:hypothetical protein [Dishui Lake large algae virus 1]|nr:hypothetical protein [Dishui Lake large algae virus 1]